MHNYSCFLFDLYNIILDDSEGMVERERYRLDNIYTILEKSLFPIKFAVLQKKYAEMISYMSELREKSAITFTPFQQVDYLLSLLNIHDVIVFKRVYDCYSDSILQISPKLIKGSENTLELLKERSKKIGLISNADRTPGNTHRILLKELAIYHYFDDITFSDEVGFSKPSPIIFETAIQKLGADKPETIFIGDAKAADSIGARNSGISVHLFKKEEENLYELAASYSGGYTE